MISIYQNLEQDEFSFIDMISDSEGMVKILMIRITSIPY